MENATSITHLLLHKQLPQNLCIIVSVHQEFGSSLDVVLDQHLSWGCSPPYAFKVAHSHHRQVGVGFGQEASVLCHMGLPIGLLRCPHYMAADLLQSEWSKESNAETRIAFMTQPWKSHHFHHCSSGWGGKPCSVKEGNTQGHESQGWGGCKDYCGHMMTQLF